MREQSIGTLTMALLLGLFMGICAEKLHSHIAQSDAVTVIADLKQEQDRKQLELIAKQQEIIGVIIDQLEEQRATSEALDKRIKRLEDK